MRLGRLREQCVAQTIVQILSNRMTHMDHLIVRIFGAAIFFAVLGSFTESLTPFNAGVSYAKGGGGQNGDQGNAGGGGKYQESQRDVETAVGLAPNGGWLKHAVAEIGKINK